MNLPKHKKIGSEIVLIESLIFNQIRGTKFFTSTTYPLAREKDIVLLIEILL